MNENEARPCGGFVTAFGVLRMPAFNLELKNAYHFLELDLGNAPEPLDRVSSRKKFWDVGTNVDLDQCAQDFKKAYEVGVDEKISQVILLNFSVIESLLEVVGAVKFEEQHITSRNVFSVLSRSVADIDRHDEATLENRKKPLVSVGKQLIKKSIFQPWKWPRLTRTFRNHLQTQNIYWLGLNAKHPVKPTDLVLAEWNLGGGKSSRYLRKNLVIDIRESIPNKWTLKVTLEVAHLGGFDEPLSQHWKGVFEVQPPHFVLDAVPIFIQAEIAPGESFSRTLTFDIKPTGMGLSASKGLSEGLGIYTPPSQNWHLDMSVSAFPQKTLERSNLNLHENLGTWRGELYGAKKVFSWVTRADRNPPFLTLHQPIDGTILDSAIQSELNFEEGDLVVELHFNEPVKRGKNKGGKIFLEDRNYAVKDIDEDPMWKGMKLLDNQTTLLLNFAQNQYQKDERFNLKIFDIEDLWGNRTDIDKRTVITR